MRRCSRRLNAIDLVWQCHLYVILISCEANADELRSGGRQDFAFRLL